MTLRLYNPGLVWHPLRLASGGGLPLLAESRAIERRMARILNEWKGTRYSDCPPCKGEMANCVGFVSSVLDELYGWDPAPLPDVPSDACFHNKRKAIRGLRWFLNRYPHRKVASNEIEAGDVLVTGPNSGGPGHAILVGPDENTLWQMHSDAHCAGLAIPTTYRLFKAYRLKDRLSWLR